MTGTGAETTARQSTRAFPQVRILGPIEAVGEHGPAALSGARQRALLAVLAMNAGTVVHQSRLIDALWGLDPPRTAVKTLRSHIARVRQALDGCGLPGTVRTRHFGYLLAVPPESVDAYRFEVIVRSVQRDLGERAPREAATVLRAGLALWRGEALADGEPTGWAAAEATRLNEARLDAVEEMWAAELRLGRHRLAVGELDRLVIGHPIRERLAGLYMLALYRCDRAADALDVYRRVRAHLAEELGTDPGAWLQRLHTDILRHDPGLDCDQIPPERPRTARTDTQPAPPARTDTRAMLPARTDTRAMLPARIVPEVPASPPVPRPAQLPAAVGHFTGRASLLATMDSLVDRPGPQARIVAVSGQAGMGKTAFVVHWARRVAERFPDGQIFVDLGGHAPDTAMTPAEVLSHALVSVGVPAGRIPAGLSAQCALYRSMVHDRHILVVLDNAGSADQVLPLVPATASSMLVLTSRVRPTALATHHAVDIVDLDALEHVEAVALLRGVLGRERVDREPAPAAELVELCGRMPLALRIVAAKLAARPGRKISEVNAELARADRLDELSVPGDSRSVRTAFAGSYRALSPSAARTFRLLGLTPGATFTVHLAAAAAAVPFDAARRAVDELAMAHLVVEVTEGRFRLHDLLRLYANECALSDEDTAGRHEAVTRILDWYLAVAAAGNRVIDPGRDRVVPVVRHQPQSLPFPADHHAALTFLDGERGNLLPVVRCAVERGDDTIAWQLTYLLTGFFDSRGHWTERVQLCRLGVTAAQRGGDAAAEGLMRSGLGVAHIMTRQFDEALPMLRDALTLMRQCADHRGEGHVHNNIAVAHAGLRRFDDAIDAYQQALAVHSANDNVLGIALALNNIGDAYVRMGRPELSSEYLSRALPLSRQLHNARLEAATLSSLGQAALALGDTSAGLEHLREALAVRQRSGDRRYEADTRNNIGVAHLYRDDHASAIEQFRHALSLSQEIGDPHLESVALANIGRAHLARRDLTAADSYLRLAEALRNRTPDSYEAANIARQRGELEHAAGRVAAACEHWCHAVRLYREANATAAADDLVASRLTEPALSRPTEPALSRPTEPVTRPGATTSPVRPGGSSGPAR